MDRRDFSRSSDSRQSFGQSGGPYRNDRDRGNYSRDYGSSENGSRSSSFRGRGGYDRRDSNSSRGSGRGDYRGGRGGFRGGRGGGPGTGRQAADDSETIDLMREETRRCDIDQVNQISAPREVKMLNIQANGYEIDVARAKVAYQYDIKWTGENKKGKTTNINIHPKGDIKSNAKNEAISTLFNQLLQENDAFFKASECREKYSYDTGSIFFSQNKLLEDMEHREFELNVANLDQKAKDYFRGMVKISAEVRMTREIHPDALNGDLENDRPAIQYLEVVFSQEQRNGGKYLCFNNKFFEKRSDDPIDQTCLTLKSGVTRSIRLIGDPAEKKLMVQMIPTKTAFYAHAKLAHLIEDSIKADIRDIHRGQNFKKADATVKNLTVQTNHLESNRTFVAAGLSDQPADRQFFEFDGREVSVAEYYKRKYKRSLQYPDLPCVVEKKGKDKSYYPIEILVVPENQRIPKAKQSTDLNAKIIRKCQNLPANNKSLIERYRADAHISNSNDFIKNTGARVESRNLISASAKQLPPPSIILDTTQKVLKGGLFGMVKGDKFAIGAEVEKLAIVLTGREDERRIEEFVEQLVLRMQTYGAHGEKTREIQSKIIKCERGIEEQLADLKRREYDFALVIGDSDDLHHGMKYSELSTKMVTQHVRPFTIGKSNHSLIDNLALKFNLKAGGLNWGIASSPAMISQSENYDLLKSLTDNTMFFGIDLSHPLGRPEPNTPLDQVDPTCVGYASNITRGSTNMDRGDYSYQYAQKTMVHPELLSSKFAAAVMAYYQKNGIFPSWIVVFRNGMSEAECEKIRKNEIPVLKNALENIRSQFPDLSSAAKLTVIMANKNSTLRIFNEHIDGYAKAPVQNVPPGTCVFEKIVSSGGSIPSFVMVAQRALIGTARPTIYHVLENADCVPMHHLQWITYCMCYTHGIVFSPTALPGPLVSAADLSKRGRNNFKHRRPVLPSDENTDLKMRQGQGDALNDEEKEELRNAETRYFTRLSELLHPVIEEKRYWA